MTTRTRQLTMAESEDSLEFEVYTPDITVTHNRLKYTCSGDGIIRRNGTTYHANLSEYLPILLKNGKINKGKSQRQKQQSADWWRDQCTFRGLPTSGSLDVVQARLRSGPNTMIKELGELAKEAKAKWKTEDVANQSRARQEYQDQQRKDELNGVNRLKEIFNDNNATLATIFKKDVNGLQHAATKLGLQFRWIQAPYISLSAEWNYNWIIIGRTAADVEAKHAGGQIRGE